MSVDLLLFIAPTSTNIIYLSDIQVIQGANCGLELNERIILGRSVEVI